MARNHQIAAQTICDPSKDRNGDAFVSTTSADGKLLIAVIADGVGSRPCDWLASKTACGFLAEKTQTVGVSSADAGLMLKEWLRELDLEIYCTTGRGRGMMCAATVLLWLHDTNQTWFASIGDTRLYRFSGAVLMQVSEDDSQAIVRRGSGGKPLFIGGAAVVQRGITNALGTGHATINVTPITFEEGSVLILCTDGFYDCTASFEADLSKVALAPDLTEAAETLALNYTGRNRDDATILILRRETSAPHISAGLPFS